METAIASSSGLRARARARWQAWLKRRIPPAREVVLDQRRIFIFPSLPGLFFLFCLVVILLAAINYQNNMSYALVFLLANIFLVAVLHTYANLSGLRIRGVSADPVFPGEEACFRVQLSASGRRDHVALRLRWREGEAADVSSVADDDVEAIELFSVATTRGWHRPGRLLIESTYPLGLLRCWTWIDLDLAALVYPAPEPCEAPTGVQLARPDGSAVPVDGNDDFFGIRAYRVGDSLQRIYWKGLARGQSLQSKVYTAYADRSVWLDWDAFGGIDLERRLSRLCFWALELERDQQEYGLRLPAVELAPGTGPEHLEAVLRTLALYQMGDTV